MERSNAGLGSEDGIAIHRNTNHKDRYAIRPSLLRQILGYAAGGAVGSGVFALIQHLGPELLGHPALVRWVFLYALLGGVLTGVWQAATQWTAARFSLSRRGAILVSGLVAGTLLGAAALLVAALEQGAGTDGLLLLQLPWADGLGGFLGGAVGGGVWQYFRRRYGRPSPIGRE
jgi:hypothetical protein